MSRQLPIGSTLQIPFQTDPLANKEVVVVKEGASVTLPVTVTSVNVTIGVVSFTPTVTGFYDVFVDSVHVGSVEIVTRSIFEILNNLEDEALGSWEWNKSTKEMKLFRRDGTELLVYTADDTPEEAFQRSVV